MSSSLFYHALVKKSRGEWGLCVIFARKESKFSPFRSFGMSNFAFGVDFVSFLLYNEEDKTFTEGALTSYEAYIDR